jgi:hypothetical protein
VPAGSAAEIANAKSAEFDGSDDWYQVGNDSSMVPTSFSIAAWVRPAATGYGLIFDATAHATAWNGYHLRYSSNGTLKDFKFGPYSSSGGSVVSTDTLNVDTWGFVVATYDNASTTAKIYVNAGTPVSDATIGGFSASNPAKVRIGDMTSASGSYTWNGHMDDVAFWNVALSAAEITEIYGLKGSGELANLNVDSGNYASADNLVGWWRMGDNDTDPSAVENMATGSASGGSAVDLAQSTASKQPSFTTEIPS